MNAEILRGFTDAIILNVLSESDSYGYKISRHIIMKTNNKMDIKDATIYLAFKRMEKEKLITSYWSDDNNSARRKYYKITEEGKEYLNTKKKEWQNNRIILDKLLLGDTNER
ncbi:MAG: PadR family transcriptional regulator [Firmicutes bacterium]|nr:PadR family transcriptional regulator [Bacillota bacterium]